MEQTGKEPAAGSPNYPGMPRWVKTSGIIVAVLAVLVVALAIFGGGQHGPDRHLPPLNTGKAEPTALLPGDR